MQNIVLSDLDIAPFLDICRIPTQVFHIDQSSAHGIETMTLKDSLEHGFLDTMRVVSGNSGAIERSPLEIMAMKRGFLGDNEPGDHS
jgi:hypothetical protein